MCGTAPYRPRQTGVILDSCRICATVCRGAAPTSEGRSPLPPPSRRQPLRPRPQGAGRARGRARACGHPLCTDARRAGEGATRLERAWPDLLAPCPPRGHRPSHAQPDGAGARQAQAVHLPRRHRRRGSARTAATLGSRALRGAGTPHGVSVRTRATGPSGQGADRSASTGRTRAGSRTAGFGFATATYADWGG